MARTRGWRRGLRIAAIAMAGLVALVAAAAGAMLAAAYTDWGRARIRTELAAVLTQTFPGGVAIGGLEGGPLGELVIRDIVLRDRAGREVVAIGRVRLEIALFALVRRRIELRDVIVERVRIAVERRGGRSNVDGMLVLDDEPLAWDVELPSLVLRDAQVSLAFDDHLDHVDDLGANLALSMPVGGTTVARLELGGRWRERAAPLAVRAQVRASPTAIEVPSADLALGEIRVAARGVTYASPAAIAGQLAVDAPADALARLLPDTLHPAVNLKLTARAAPGGTNAIQLAGAIAGSPLDGNLTLAVGAPTLRVAGEISATQLDARRLGPAPIATALDTELRIDVAIDPSRTATTMVDGAIELTSRGRVGDLTIDELTTRIGLAQSTATIAVTARVQGSARATLEAQAEMRPDGAIALPRARLVATIGELKRVLPPSFGVAGALAVDLSARGELRDGTPDLAVSGHIVGTELVAAAGRIGRARLDLALSGPPDHPRGTATATLERAVLDGSPLPWVSASGRSQPDGTFAIAVRSESLPGAPAPAPWQITADAVGRFGPGRASIALGAYRGRARGVEFHGAGGAVELRDGRVTVEKLRAAVGGGGIELDARYQLRGARAGDAVGRVAVRRIDLALVDRTFALGGELAGVTDATVDLRRERGVIGATAAGAATGLVLHRGAAPVDVSFKATVTPTRVAAELAARADRIGAVSAALELEPPRAFADRAAWTRLERRAFHRLDLRAQGVELAELAQAVGVAPTVEGRVDVDLALGGAEIQGTVRGQGLIAAGLPAPLDIALELHGAGSEDARVTTRAAMHEVGGGTIAATFRIPFRPFELAAWTRLDATTVRDIEIKLDEVAIDARRAVRLGLPDDWQGRVAVAIDVAPGLDRATATIVAADVIGGPLFRPVDATIALELDRRHVSATVRAVTAGAPLATASLRLAIDPIAVVRGGRAGLTRLPISGELHVDPVELQPVLLLLGRDDGRTVRGALGADATFRGTLAEPNAAVTLVGTGIGTARRLVAQELRCSLRYANDAVTASIRGRHEDGSPVITLDGRAPLDRLDATVVTLTANKLDLRPLARLVAPELIGVAGLVDAEVRLRGIDPATAEIGGRLAIREAELPLIDALGALHDASFELEVRNRRARLVLTGGIESGQITARGDAALRGLLPSTATLDVAVRNLSLITTLAPRISGEVHTSLTRAGDDWKVTAEITRGQVVIPETSGRELHPTGLPTNLVIVDGNAPPGGSPSAAVVDDAPRTGPRLDVSARIRPVEVRSEQFRGQVSGALTAAITPDQVILAGTLTADRGDVTLFSRRYRIDSATVRFDDDFDPLLDVRLVADLPQLTLRIAATGRLSAPQLTLSSDSGGYTEAELLGFVLGGAPSDEAAPVIDDTAKVVAAAAVTQVFGSYLTKLVPVRIDILRYDAPTSTHSGALTIGRRLSDRLYVSWRSRVDARQDENTDEGTLEYWLSRSFLLDGVVGNRGVHGLDVLWQRRW